MLNFKRYSFDFDAALSHLVFVFACNKLTLKHLLLGMKISRAVFDESEEKSFLLNCCWS